MIEKLEPRGKYSGVKIHLTGEESRRFMELYERIQVQHSTHAFTNYEDENFSFKFVTSLGKKIRKLLVECPHLFEDRTKEQIEEALKTEQEQAALKLNALQKGEKWNQISKPTTKVKSPQVVP